MGEVTIKVLPKRQRGESVDSMCFPKNPVPAGELSSIVSEQWGR